MIPLLIGAAVGAAVSGISTLINSKKEKKRIGQQQDLERQAFGYERAYNRGMFNLQQGQALEGLGIQRNRLAQAYGADLDAFNLGVQGQGLQSQAAQVSLADSAGMAMAQQGASGTRGSGALQMRIDFQDNQLARQVGLQNMGNALTAQNMGQQYSNRFDDIGREIDSWRPDGYRGQAKSLGDIYAEQMHGLKMQGFQQAISDAGATGLDYTANMLGGAAQGAAVGGQIGGLIEQMQARKAAGAAAGMDAIQSAWPTQSYFSSAVPKGKPLGYSLLWDK